MKIELASKKNKKKRTIEEMHRNERTIEKMHRNERTTMLLIVYLRVTIKSKLLNIAMKKENIFLFCLFSFSLSLFLFFFFLKTNIQCQKK